MYDTVFILAQWSVQPVELRIALHQMDELDELEDDGLDDEAVKKIDARICNAL